nr:hypothetical protein [Microvirga puerhi]
MGLQSSGKTTFAAALWYLVDSREIDTVLSKGRHNGDFQYLETISSSWAAGWQVPRTSSDSLEPIRINLLHSQSNEEIDLHFVDLSGEAFEKIFATRMIEEKIKSLFSSMQGLLLFVTAIRKKDDLSILDVGLAMPDEMPSEVDDDEIVPAAESDPIQKLSEFSPSSSPQQVQLVDLLGALADAPLFKQPSRIAVIISAWDKAPPQTEPEQWLKTRMPLLYQYLRNQQLEIPFRVYGVSAQGGSVPKKEQPNVPSDRAELLKVKIAGERIKVVGHDAANHDLSHPIRWLSGLES